jgi:hypothetical protein
MGLLSVESGYQCWFDLVSRLRAYLVKGVDGVVDIKPAELREPSRLGHGLRIAG